MMAIQIQYLGWSSFRLVSSQGTKIVVDPFLEGDAQRGIAPAVASPKDLTDTQALLVTHSAHDHAAQVLAIMKTSRATLFCGRDVGLKAEKEGIPAERLFYMISGVEFKFLDIRVKALEASHISMSEFQGQWLTGVPLSFIVDFGADGKIFFSGDNALGPHYQFYGEIYKPDLAILGIGGVPLNGQYLVELPPYEAALATRWLKVRAVIPMHYLSNEAEEFKNELPRHAPGVDLAIMQPGETLRFSKDQGLMRRKIERTAKAEETQ